MLVIQPLLSKESNQKAESFLIPLRITKLLCSMSTQLKAPGGVVTESGFFERALEAIGNSNAVVLNPASHSNLRHWIASASLPEYRLGFSGFLKGDKIEAGLKRLREWLHPALPSDAIFDTAGAPMAVFVQAGSANQKSNTLISAGILVDLQYQVANQGSGADVFIEGEMTILDTRLDSTFLRNVNLDQLHK